MENDVLYENGPSTISSMVQTYVHLKHNKLQEKNANGCFVSA